MRTFQMRYAGVAQLVERHLAKVAVDGSSPFARSIDFHGRLAFTPGGRFVCTTIDYYGLRTSNVNSLRSPS